MCLGVPLRVFRAGEEGLPDASGGEAGARALRYACFERLCREGIDRIALAHTVTDQAETLLFRLARGTGLHGAGGIRPVRGAYVRPLLCLTRAEVEAWCAACGQPWVTDETNLSDDYARNRLRHDALPALRQANAGAERNLARFCEKAAQADAYFARAAARLLDQAAGISPADCPPAARAALAAGEKVYRLERKNTSACCAGWCSRGRGLSSCGPGCGCGPARAASGRKKPCPTWRAAPWSRPLSAPKMGLYIPWAEACGCVCGLRNRFFKKKHRPFTKKT